MGPRSRSRRHGTGEGRGGQAVGGGGMARGKKGVRGCRGGARGRGAQRAPLWRAGRSAAGGRDAAASDLQIKGGGARQGTVKGTAARKATGLHLGQGGAGEATGGGRTDRPVRREELTADAEEGGDVGPLGAGAGTSLHRQSRTRAPAPGGRQAQHSACACRGDLPRRPACLSVRPTRPTRSRAARADPAAPTARLDTFGSRRAPAAEELTPASAAK